MEETISLREIFNILKKRLVLIIATTFIGLGMAGIMTFFVITPEYSSRAQIIVTLPQSANGSTSLTEINTNLQMINTYTELITSDRVIDAVQETLTNNYGYTLSSGELRSAISVEQNTDSSLMFYVQALTDNAVLSQTIANVTAETFQTTASEVLNNTIDTISIISSAQVELSPVSPNNKLNLAIGLVLGLIIGVGLAFLLELLDKTVKDDRFVVEDLGFTVLGIVPKMTNDELASTMRRNRATENIKNKNGASEDPVRRQRRRV